MNITLELLNLRIEHFRNLLQTLLASNLPTSPSVIECSQKLDKLLVSYEKVSTYLKKAA